MLKHRVAEFENHYRISFCFDYFNVNMRSSTFHKKIIETKRYELGHIKSPFYVVERLLDIFIFISYFWNSYQNINFDFTDNF